MPTFKRKTEILEGTRFWPDILPLPKGVYLEDEEYWFENENEACVITPGDWILTNTSGYQWSWPDEYLKNHYDLIIFKDSDHKEIKCLVWEE